MDVVQSNNDTRDCGTFFLDVVGPYSAGQVRVNWLDEPRPSNQQVDDVINRVWREQTGPEVQGERRIFDGRLCRLISYTADRGHFAMTLGPVSFREFLGTNLSNAHLRYLHGPEVLADPLGVSGAVITDDGYILLGRRSRKVAFHAGYRHPFGGMVEPGSNGKPPCPFVTMLEELRQELSIEPEMVSQQTCLGLVRDKKILQPELIFELTVKAAVPQFYAMLTQAGDSHEHTELLPVRDEPSSVIDYIEKHFKELTPVATATLLLHGLRKWGIGWFTGARGYLRRVI